VLAQEEEEQRHRHHEPHHTRHLDQHEHDHNSAGDLQDKSSPLHTNLPIQKNKPAVAELQATAKEHTTSNSAQEATAESKEKQKCVCDHLAFSLENPFWGKMILTIVPFLFFSHLHNHDMLC
jgi:FtsZ-interacting cell division protein ZipA